MLATEPITHADLPKRSAGWCQTCAHRVFDPLNRTSYGNPVRVCEVHGCRVKWTDRACLNDYQFRDRDTPEHRAYSREQMRLYRARATARVLARLEAEHPLPEPTPAVAVLLTRCPRCGSRMLYRDADGHGCNWCGWHDWAAGSEPIAMLRPDGEMTYYPIKGRRWDG